jgi:hypothetical protein
MKSSHLFAAICAVVLSAEATNTAKALDFQLTAAKSRAASCFTRKHPRAVRGSGQSRRWRSRHRFTIAATQ